MTFANNTHVINVRPEDRSEFRSKNRIAVVLSDTRESGSVVTGRLGENRQTGYDRNVGQTSDFCV